MDIAHLNSGELILHLAELDYMLQHGELSARDQVEYVECENELIRREKEYAG